MKKTLLFFAVVFWIFLNYFNTISADLVNKKEINTINKEIKKFLKANHFIEEKDEREYLPIDIDNDSIKDILVLFTVQSDNPGYVGRNTCAQNIAYFKRAKKTLKLQGILEEVGGCGYSQGMATFVEPQNNNVLIELDYFYEDNRKELKTIKLINGELQMLGVED